MARVEMKVRTDGGHGGREKVGVLRRLEPGVSLDLVV